MTTLEGRPTAHTWFKRIFGENRTILDLPEDYFDNNDILDLPEEYFDKSDANMNTFEGKPTNNTFFRRINGGNSMIHDVSEYSHSYGMSMHYSVFINSKHIFEEFVNLHCFLLFINF